MNRKLTFKDKALLAIGRLPDTATIEHVSEQIEILAALHRSEKASSQRRVVHHEEMMRRFGICLRRKSLKSTPGHTFGPKR
ncbi:MAG: hypothetical protein AB1705_21945 [Verrucomicrobiota bacterium]